MPPSRKNDRNRRDGAEVIFIFQNGIGEYPYSPERLDAVKEIKDFVSASAEEYLRRGLQIKIGAMPNGAIMEAGPTYFRSILINLLDNSAKYEEEKIMRRILIIEDDETIAAIERDYLEINDFKADIAGNGPDGISMGRSGHYDLILLDLMLPGIDGFTVCRRLRETLDIPILMVTARQEDIDKIKGLGMGADDYITKPFSPNVLVARIKANLAQYDRLRHAGGQDRSQIQIGNILLQQDTRRVFVEGTEPAFPGCAITVLYRTGQPA